MTEESVSVQEFLGIEELEEMAKAEPNNVQVQRRWAWSLLRTNHAQQAKDVLEAQTKKAPNDPEVWYALGVVLLRTNEIKDAKAAFEKVNELLKDQIEGNPRMTMLDHMAKTQINKLGDR